MSEPVLECTGVSKSYGAVRAVAEVSLQLVRGEVLGLVGPNGAGKTTLVDLIGGEQRPDAGSITVGGETLAGPPSQRARRNRLARTFQHPQIALDLSVRENLLVGFMSRRLASVGGMLRELFAGMARGSREAEQAAEVDKVSASLGLQDIDRPCKDLTLGELRLVEVGRALLMSPSLMLLDEPFAGSDARGIAGIRAAIDTVRRAGCGIVLVDHNVDIVASIVDRIALLNLGQKVFDGAPADCLASAQMQAVYFGERA